MYLLININLFIRMFMMAVLHITFEQTQTPAQRMDEKEI